MIHFDNNLSFRKLIVWFNKEIYNKPQKAEFMLAKSKITTDRNYQSVLHDKDVREHAATYRVVW